MIGLEMLKEKKQSDDLENNNHVKIAPGYISQANNATHLCCRKCLKSIRLNDKEEETEIKCQVCNENHLIKTKVLKGLAKSGSGGCCVIF